MSYFQAGANTVLYKNKYVGDKKLSKNKKKFVQAAYKNVKSTPAEQYAEQAVDHILKAQKFSKKENKISELNQAKNSLNQASLRGHLDDNERFSMASEYANLLVDKSLRDLQMDKAKKPPLGWTKKAAQIGPRILLNNYVDDERVSQGLDPYAQEMYNTTLKPKYDF